MRPIAKGFDANRGDRVCRKPGVEYCGFPKAATTDFEEAMEYARRRAMETGFVQHLKRHAKHGWWLTICTDKKLSSR